MINSIAISVSFYYFLFNYGQRGQLQGRMLILDLQSEQFPQYGRLRSYYGQPFIWCMLHNFGGTLGMFGSAQIVNQVYRKFPSPSVIRAAR